MNLEIDAKLLRQAGRSRKTGPRPQSQDKLSELKIMVEELMRLNVIRVSTADTASQVLLVAKKGPKKATLLHKLLRCERSDQSTRELASDKHQIYVEETRSD